MKGGSDVEEEKEEEEGVRGREGGKRRGSEGEYRGGDYYEYIAQSSSIK